MTILLLMFFFLIMEPITALMTGAAFFFMFLLISFLIYPLIMASRISKRRTVLNKELPFTLSELAIYASTGLSPIQMIRKISQRTEQNFMTMEFKKLIYKIDVEGKDIISAISELAKETPSEHFRELLWDFSNMIHEGGDIERYLRDRADKGLSLKRTIQLENIVSLSAIMEMYITLVLVGVLFAGVGAFLMDVMGGTMGGIDGGGVLIIMTFILMPVAVIFVITLTAMSYSRVE
jgi:flagellar protein FlaJ